MNIVGSYLSPLEFIIKQVGTHTFMVTLPPSVKYLATNIKATTMTPMTQLGRLHVIDNTLLNTNRLARAVIHVSNLSKLSAKLLLVLR